MTQAKIASTEFHHSEAPAPLRELEERLGLLRHKLDGWCVWPLFRMDAGYARDTQPPRDIIGSKLPYGRIPLIRIALGDLWRLLFVKRSNCPVVVTASSYRTESDEAGRPMDWQFDEFCLKVQDVIKIDEINNRELFELSDKSAFPSRLSNAAVLAFGSLLVSRLPVAKDVLELARAIVADLHTQPEWRSFTLAGVANSLTTFRRKRIIWKAIFRKLGTPIILMQNGYFDHDLIAAGKECGARVAELQHGTFFDNGPEYCWSNYASDYRDTMPVPDRLLLYGDHWKNILSKDSFWGDRVRVIGSTRIDRYRDRRGRTQRTHLGAECLLVVTTQGRSQKGVVAWIADLLSCTKDWAGLRVVIKLHPVSDFSRQAYVDALPNDERLSILTGHERPSTFEWLAAADFHASVNSATHYEAVSLGARNFVLPFGSYRTMEPMVRSGHALMPETPAAMAALMRKLVGQPLPENIGNYYFKPDTVENLMREVDELKNLPASPDRQNTPVTAGQA